ncbi:hypothetical protein FTUN_2246 [Frigoriglobus tundricola]|uniref:Uncharacterized protein n=1 Tax=Frigoriglobus tundricola TaxID=2774151 RepID=A0A6M5YMA6_9BACT|nr:hypothetical protein FTUN_2246 [Frigoriglobus tundricola]
MRFCSCQLKENNSRMPGCIEPSWPSLFTAPWVSEGQQQTGTVDGERTRLSHPFSRASRVVDVERHRLACGVSGPFTQQHVAWHVCF